MAWKNERHKEKDRHTENLLAPILPVEARSPHSVGGCHRGYPDQMKVSRSDQPADEAYPDGLVELSFLGTRPWRTLQPVSNAGRMYDPLTQVTSDLSGRRYGSVVDRGCRFRSKQKIHCCHQGSDIGPRDSRMRANETEFVIQFRHLCSSRDRCFDTQRRGVPPVVPFSLAPQRQCQKGATSGSQGGQAALSQQRRH